MKDIKTKNTKPFKSVLLKCGSSSWSLKREVAQLVEKICEKAFLYMASSAHSSFMIVHK